jgi:hypothetical protein
MKDVLQNRNVNMGSKGKHENSGRLQKPVKHHGMLYYQDMRNLGWNLRKIWSTMSLFYVMSCGDTMNTISEPTDNDEWHDMH